MAIEGVIGAGKTTLARKLAATLSAKLLLEQPDENPFLPRFYRDPAGAAFSTQLTFLLQRAGQVEQLRQRDLFTEIWVADFMFEKDRLFAELTLNAADFELYAQVFERLSFDLPPPDRIIHLTAPLDLLMSRIASRGRAYEAPIEPAYLARLASGYARWMRGSTGTPLIEIDTAQFDFLNRDADYAELLEALESGEPQVRLPRGALL
ncbi:MAG: deoxynucleoside kinase [Panacagrimonas sp.]